MTVSPLAGKLLPPSALVDVPRLVTAYFTQTPDPTNPAQRVSCERAVEIRHRKIASRRRPRQPVRYRAAGKSSIRTVDLLG